MHERALLGLRQLLVSIDQLVYILIAVPIYIAIGGPCASADETISSRVGRAAVKGHTWGLILEALIDWIFVHLGAAPGHCRRNIETAWRGDRPQA